MKYLLAFIAAGTALAAILGFNLFSSITYPSIENIDSVEDAFKPYIESDKTAGISIGVFNNGDIEYFHFGEVVKEEGVKPNQETIYEIGSISKTFTAALLSGLINEEAVSLDDHICTYLPEDNCPWKEEVDAITLEDMSKHRSGFPRLPNNLGPSYFKDPTNPYAAYSQEDLYKGVKELTADILTKRDHEYSNFGVGLLGDILATSQNTTYPQLLESMIFAKLEMSDSHINVPKEKESRFNKGYNGGSETSHWDFPSLAGCGGIKSTISDMMIYMDANMSSKAPFDFTHSNLSETSDGETIGLAWYITNLNDNDVLWHNGGTGGFSTMMMMDKKKQIGIVVLSNASESVDQPSVLAMKYLLGK